MTNICISLKTKSKNSAKNRNFHEMKTLGKLQALLTIELTMHVLCNRTIIVAHSVRCSSLNRSHARQSSIRGNPKIIEVP